MAKPHFDGKVILVTGASSGIGEQMVKQFVSLGAAQVIIAARRTKELERVKSECSKPENVKIWTLDLSDP
jgi:NADP-dependent 3-hydroxy acid dehydrogenase YdfG